MLDVDNLKDINDRFRHAAGDRLLKEVASAIRESIRAMDVAARFGGDEFAVLLPDMDEDEGQTVAKRILAAARRRAFVAHGEMVVPSVSIGVAACHHGRPEDPAELVSLADMALYRVKKSGHKGSVVTIGQDEH